MKIRLIFAFAMVLAILFSCEKDEEPTITGGDNTSNEYRIKESVFYELGLVDESKAIYTYDNENRLVLIENFTQQIGEWVEATKFVNTYDGENVMTQLYVNSDTGWYVTAEIENTVVDGNSIDLKRFQIQDGERKITHRLTRSYSGDKVLEELQFMDFEGIMDTTDKTQFTYEDGVLATRIYSKRTPQIDTAWTKLNMSEYSYLGNTETILSYYSSNEEWLLSSKRVITKEGDRVISTATYVWDEVSELWTNEIIETPIYVASGSGYIMESLSGMDGSHVTVTEYESGSGNNDLFNYWFYGH